MVPIDFAEHHVAGEDHQLGRRLALVGDRQAVAGPVQRKAADQPLLVEVPPVGHAGVQAVAEEVVHLVDVDRAGKHAGEDLAGAVAGLLAQQRNHVAGIELPLLAQRIGHLAFQQKAVGEQLVRGHARQVDVFDGMAERPMAQVVQQGRDDQQLGVLGPHGLGETLVVGQLLQEQQRQPVDAQRVLEPRMDCGRVDQRNQAELADPRQPAELRAIDQMPDPAGHGNVQLRRDADQRTPGVQAGNFRNLQDRRHGILDFRFWILDFTLWTLGTGEIAIWDLRSGICEIRRFKQNPKSKI